LHEFGEKRKKSSQAVKSKASQNHRIMELTIAGPEKKIGSRKKDAESLRNRPAIS